MTILTVRQLRTFIALKLSEHGRHLRRMAASPNFWLVLLSDIALLLLAHALAFYLRFESLFPEKIVHYYYHFMPVIIGVKLPVFYMFRLYNGMWRYTGLRDLQNIIGAVFVSSVTLLALMLLFNRFQGFSRSVFVMDALFTLLFIFASRISIRFAFQRNRQRQERNIRKKRLLLIGAGDAGEKTAREIEDNPTIPYEVVGFVDDDPEKWGMRIHGIPVLGAADELVEHAANTGADELLISVVALSAAQMKRIVGLCQETSLPFKVLPSLGELIDGRVSINSIRDITYKDLLGREEVVLDQAEIGSYLRGKDILVTGAGGSIGSELCRQIIRFAPGRLILYDSCEANLYNIQMELLHEHGIEDAMPVLGEVQDLRLLDRVFREHRPKVVFHAAAYKHVPLLERNPWQAVTNNILATQLLIEAVIRHRVERFVLVSTDKAVRPTSVMGASKRMTELLMLAYSRNHWDGSFSGKWEEIDNYGDPSAYYAAEAPNHGSKFMAVRFGNVLGSSGSVLPLFKRQIERGGPVTVTHPEITRYFMSIEEAAQLILQAGSMGGDGEIFILKMGEPVKIDQMAREMIRLAGKQPDIDIEIVYSGLRSGEKLYEELITEGEGIIPTGYQKIMVLRNDGSVLAEKKRVLEDLISNAEFHDEHGIKRLLQHIIPEYKNNGPNSK